MYGGVSMKKSKTNLMYASALLSTLFLFVFLFLYSCGGGSSGGSDGDSDDTGTYSDTSLKGAWLTVASTPISEERGYYIMDGNGNITEYGAFGMETPGHYTVDADGSIDFIHTGTSDVYDLTGQLTSETSFTMQGTVNGDPVSVQFGKVTDTSICQGTWTGTVSGHDISFTVNELGEITSSTGIFAPLSGHMFSLNGMATAFFSTGIQAEYNEIMLAGTFANNSFDGISIIDIEGYDDGAMLLTQSSDSNDDAVTIVDFVGTWTGSGTFTSQEDSEVTTNTDPLIITIAGDQLIANDITGTVSDGIWYLEIANPSPSNPDCTEWSVSGIAWLEENATELHIEASGTFCGSGGGKQGTYTGVYHKQ